MKTFIITINSEFLWKIERYRVEDYEVKGCITYWSEFRWLWFIVKYNICRVTE